jgi:hypothetical protein
MQIICILVSFYDSVFDDRNFLDSHMHEDVFFSENFNNEESVERDRGYVYGAGKTPSIAHAFPFHFSTEISTSQIVNET